MNHGKMPTMIPVSSGYTKAWNDFIANVLEIMSPDVRKYYEDVTMGLHFEDSVRSFHVSVTVPTLTPKEALDEGLYG